MLEVVQDQIGSLTEFGPVFRKEKRSYLYIEALSDPSLLFSEAVKNIPSQKFLNRMPEPRIKNS